MDTTRCAREGAACASIREGSFMSTSVGEVPQAVLARYRALANAKTKPLQGGLINDTFLVEGEISAVVQRLHPIFEGRVNDDIDVVTRFIAAKGLPTPRLIRADDGQSYVTHQDRPWRAIAYVPGRTHARLQSAEMAYEAGALVGRFHAALMDLQHDYAFSRGNVHDTPRHVNNLQKSLADCTSHRLYDQVVALAEPILAQAKQLSDFSHLPLRHSHGDLKVSNLRFDEQGKGLCLLDLDTLSQMIWPFEMGDAFRSWCNPGGEDEDHVRFDLAFFQAAIGGYAQAAGDFLLPAEIRALVDGIRTISLELSIRFLADALRENYFGFDATRFAARGEHNLLRAKGQWGLFRSLSAQREAAQDIVARAFALGPLG